MNRIRFVCGTLTSLNGKGFKIVDCALSLVVEKVKRKRKAS